MPRGLLKEAVEQGDLICSVLEKMSLKIAQPVRCQLSLMTFHLKTLSDNFGYVCSFQKMPKLDACCPNFATLLWRLCLHWNFLKPFIFINYTRWQCILSYDNSTAMCKFLKTISTPWRDSNPECLHWNYAKKTWFLSCRFIGIYISSASNNEWNLKIWECESLRRSIDI
jgi:hypothetical protein